VPDTARDAAEKPLVDFVSFVLDDVQRTWTGILAGSSTPYRHAKLVLFRNSYPSTCGEASQATGPFYCPGDEKVYLDLGFFDELKRRFGAPGEFAQAYVIAHELGHHVQTILGIEAKARRLQQGGNANAVSVKIELQADCFAGIWANSTERRSIVDESDIDAGLRAAAAVGDDRLQKMATGHVSPETFTHGSSAQRMEWFKRGLEGGAVSSCDTFSGR
jgi:predicted metalloprotease